MLKLLKLIDEEGYVWDAENLELRKKDRKLPKSWKEFCEMFPVKDGECYIDKGSDIVEYKIVDLRNTMSDRNILPDLATAEAVRVLMQLIQLRDCYNGDWVPDWTNKELKFVIHLEGGKVKKFDWYRTASSPLYFKTMELRDEFLRNFRPLIEKLKPLYGIKIDNQQ